MESFSVHLLSNVSPDLFPENNASKFSTNLANEINLSEGEWEVGVRNIMYPTHVSTTSVDDKINVFNYEKYYRGLLPIPPQGKFEDKNYGAIIDLTERRSYPKWEKQLAPVVDLILNTVNESIWVKEKELFTLSYMKKYNKFALQVHHSDVLVIFSTHLASLLGFKKSAFVKGGQVWAWSAFGIGRHGVDYNNLKIYLYDKSTLLTATYKMDVSGENEANTCLRAYVPYFFDDKFDDYGYFPMPERTMQFCPDEGRIYQWSNSLSYLQKKHAIEELCYYFDATTTKELKLDDAYTTLYEGTKTPTQNLSQSKSHKTKLQQVFVTFIYDYVPKHYPRSVLMSPKPIASFSIASKEKVKDPTSLVPMINKESKKYQYEFKFDTKEKRFKLKIGNDYAIQMSKSLTSISGFDSNENDIYQANTTATALEFPILNRGITALYVYTNIIQGVYIGNVQAPLLLICPFKNKESKDDVHQMEFLNPCYTPLNRSVINQIDIAIYDDAGSLIPFLSGKTKLSLDFRRKR